MTKITAEVIQKSLLIQLAHVKRIPGIPIKITSITSSVMGPSVAKEKGKKDKTKQIVRRMNEEDYDRTEPKRRTM